MTVSRHLRHPWVFALLFSLALTVILLSKAPTATADQLLPGAAKEDDLQPASLVAKQPAPTVNQPVALTAGVQKTVLNNGLTVLTKEVKTAPVVTVQVWYRIGSRNEAPGVNGIAHQLEHLMFKGTKDRPIQFGRFFNALGSDSNAFTSYDMTAYFGTVERDKLQPLLVLEADRMQNAIIDKDALASEKRVVISELQGYENNPDYRLGRAVMRAALPDSPYGLMVGGTKADVEKFTVEQVREYYRNFYRPDNATLIVVGDFDTKTLLQQIEATFGKVPNPSQPLPVEQAASKPGTVSKPNTTPIVLREPGSAALYTAIYPLPDVKSPDVPALRVMDAVLSGGRSSRLDRDLVEAGLASKINAYAANLIGSGWYEISATAVPGKDLKQIDQAALKTLSDLAQKGVTADELERAKSQLRAAIILNNRTITNQAMQLGDDYVSTGDYRYTEKLLAQIDQVTAGDVQRVASTYLTPQNRAVGLFEPTQVTAKGGGTTPQGQTSENFSPGKPVDPAELQKYLPSTAASQTQSQPQPLPEKLTLVNGLQVLLFPDRSTPTVTLSGHVDAGSAFDIEQTAGLASLTAENLLNGTQSRDYLTIAKLLEDRGASLDISSNREGVSILGTTLSQDLPVLINILADVLRNAAFPVDQLELSRQQALTQLKLDLDDPSRLGRRTFQQAVYPAGHPFHNFPTVTSLKAITRDHVVDFYRQHYHPDSTILTLVGDFDPAQVRNLLNRELGSWEDPSRDVAPVVPDVPLPAKSERLTPVLPGKTQSISYLGYNSIARTDSQYYAATILNQILGGSTLASRLGTEIRDRQGLTYGIYSYFAGGRFPGPFLVVMQTAPEDANRAIASTVALMEQFRKTGVTAAEVEEAKRSLISGYAVDQADPDNLARTITRNAAYGLSREELRQFPEKIQAVTLEQVNQAIQALLHPDRLVVVTAGPPSPVLQK